MESGQTRSAERRRPAWSAPTAALYTQTTYRIIGAAMKVHNQLGPGLREIVYQHALSSAMREAGLSFEEEKPVQVTLDDEQVGLFYLDHLVEGSVVVEEKALSHLLTNDEVGQVVTYLAATEMPIGLLINFGRRRLEYRRILPPKKLEGWRERAARYAWRPREAVMESAPSYPLIRSTSADGPSAADNPGAENSRSPSVDDPSISNDKRPS